MSDRGASPPGGKKDPGPIAIIVGFAAVLAIIGWLAGDGRNPTGPSSTVDESEPVVGFEVTICEVDRSIGFAEARVEFTVSEPVDYVGFSGDLVAADGTIVGEGIGNRSNVLPGKTYLTNVIYVIEGPAGRGAVTCHVNLDAVF